ncbi:hypothetical protein JBF12_00825, partial [Streptomyces javensis]|nr:hypothetical protein [Streptomyces javensis]
PFVESALAALTITWDGGFADADYAPLDWMRCEVHIGLAPDFTPDQATLRDTIESPQGGTVTVPVPYSTHFVRLRTRTTSGVAGAATSTVVGSPRKAATTDISAGAVTADLIAADAIAGKNITGGTITGSTIQTASSGQRIVLNYVTNTITVYNANDDVVAQVVPEGNYGGGGFWSRGFQSPVNIYSQLANGKLIFNTIDGAAITDGGLSFTLAPSSKAAQLVIDSGSATQANPPATIRLNAKSNSLARPTVTISDNGSGPCDLQVTGKVTANGIGTPLVARATSDRSRTSTGLTDDPELRFTVSPSTTYLLTGWIKYSAGTDGDIVLDWTIPSGALGEWAGHGPGVTLISTNDGPGTLIADTASTRGYLLRAESNDISQARTFGGTGDAQPYSVFIMGILRVQGTGGLYALQWAQGSSSTVETTVFADSWLRLEPVP